MYSTYLSTFLLVLSSSAFTVGSAVNATVTESATATLSSTISVTPTPTSDASNLSGHQCSSTLDLATRFTNTTSNLIQIVNYFNQTTWDNTTQKNVVTRVPFNVTGTVSLLNACAFKVQNFSFTPAVPDTVWYGKVGGNYTIGNMASYWSIQELKNSTLSFQLIEGTSFENIDTLILYSQYYELQLAYVQFPRISNKTRGNNGGNLSYWDTTDQTSGASRSISHSNTFWWLPIVLVVYLSFT